MKVWLIFNAQLTVVVGFIYVFKQKHINESAVRVLKVVTKPSQRLKTCKIYMFRVEVKYLANNLTSSLDLE